MSTRFHPVPRQRGFSLVELLVSVVVGLLALMFATKLFVASEQNRESSLGGSDSMQNGMQALFSINRDVAQAGWGLNDPLIAGCNTVFADARGYALAPAARTDGAGVTTTITPMAAVLIENNGADPDRVTLYAGTSQSGTGEVGLSSDYAGGSTISVDRIAFGFSSGDALLMVPESSDGVTIKCALGQLAAAPTMVSGVQTFSIAAGAGARFNQAAGLGQNYKAGVTRLFNLGPAESLSFHTWSVNRGFLQLRAADMGDASATAQSVVDNIVSLKAQYGFDTSAGAAFNPENGMRITRWSSDMVDADGDTIIGGPGDYQRIAAVRIAVVARSRNPDKPSASGVCSATPAKPVVFATAEPAGVAPVPVTVNVAVAADTVDWKCYRYRSFETVVPMRNLAWRPTSQ
jgi:type IV pilus assembly protein PilW